MWHPTDDRSAMLPRAAEVREELPLLQYADTLRKMEETVRMAAETAERADRVLRETGEYRDLEAAKEKLTDAKRAAVERCAVVSAEAENVKTSKRRLRDGAGDVVKAKRDAAKALKAARAALADYAGEVIGAVKRQGRSS